MDFVVVHRGQLIGTECDWCAEGFDPRALRAFRKAWLVVERFVATCGTEMSFLGCGDGSQYRFLGTGDLLRRVG